MIEDGIKVKAGFLKLGAEEDDINEKDDLNFEGFKKLMKYYRKKVQGNWDHGNRKSLIMFYYAGHGVMDNLTEAVCNPDMDEKKKYYPLEQSLLTLAKE